MYLRNGTSLINHAGSTANFVDGNLRIQSGSTFENMRGATFNTSGPNSMGISTSGVDSAFNNAGEFNSDALNQRLRVFNNSGSVNVLSDTLTLSAAACRPAA